MPEPIGFDHWGQLWAVLNGINAQRMSHGLRGCAPNDQLWHAAQFHSDWMATRDILAHFGIGDGDPWQRINQAGYSYGYAGEIAAEGQRSAAEVVQAWMNSPGHRANILDQHYTEFGCGLAGDSRGVLFWCVDFASPA